MRQLLHCIIFCFFSLTSVGQIGRIGINTTVPSAMLHVRDSNVLFSGLSNSAFLPVSQGPPPATGQGVRMMWYPDKAAFRVGFVLNTNWDKDSIGDYSFAAGYNSRASGNNSTAIGSGIATGNYSVAIGTSTQSIGSSSTAIGRFSIASGNNSTAMGQSSISSGLTSTAMGDHTVASGVQSTTMGELTQAKGINTVAMGFQSIANGQNSLAQGNLATANGTNSTAMGYQTFANGFASLATGLSTNSIGTNSTSMGEFTIASGNNSVAIGHYTTARAFSSLSIGRFNDSVISSSQTSWVLTDPLFTIGNGLTDNNRGNAFMVLKNASTGINTSSPQAMLHVKESIVSGAQYNPNAVAIFEGASTGAFIQLSHPTTSQSGILSGTSVTDVRSGIVFRADSAIHFRTGGNTTRFAMDKTGQLGVGTVSPSEKLEVIGNIKLTGEINKTATGLSNLLPICYGAVDATGAIDGGTGNFTVAESPPGYYEITITGETYNSGSYFTVATPSAGASTPRYTTISSNFAGKLIIRIWTHQGNPVDCDFQFVVYKN